MKNILLLIAVMSAGANVSMSADTKLLEDPIGYAKKNPITTAGATLGTLAGGTGAYYYGGPAINMAKTIPGMVMAIPGMVMGLLPKSSTSAAKNLAETIGKADLTNAAKQVAETVGKADLTNAVKTLAENTDLTSATKKLADAAGTNVTVPATLMDKARVGMTMIKDKASELGTLALQNPVYTTAGLLAAATAAYMMMPKAKVTETTPGNDAPKTSGLSSQQLYNEIMTKAKKSMTRKDKDAALNLIDKMLKNGDNTDTINATVKNVYAFYLN